MLVTGRSPVERYLYGDSWLLLWTSTQIRMRNDDMTFPLRIRKGSYNRDCPISLEDTFRKCLTICILYSENHSHVINLGPTVIIPPMSANCDAKE
jgi:hypothetical protein